MDPGSIFTQMEYIHFFVFVDAVLELNLGESFAQNDGFDGAVVDAVRIAVVDDESVDFRVDVLVLLIVLGFIIEQRSFGYMYETHGFVDI